MAAALSWERADDPGRSSRPYGYIFTIKSCLFDLARPPLTLPVNASRSYTRRLLLGQGKRFAALNALRFARIFRTSTYVNFHTSRRRRVAGILPSFDAAAWMLGLPQVPRGEPLTASKPVDFVERSLHESRRENSCSPCCSVRASHRAAAQGAPAASQAQQVLATAAAEQKYTFLVFYKDNGPATQAMAQAVKRGVESRGDRATWRTSMSAVLPRSLSSIALAWAGPHADDGGGGAKRSDDQTDPGQYF